MNTFCIRYQLKPNPLHENYGQFSGSHACVLVVTDDPSSVAQRAGKHVENEGWIIESSEEPYIIYREDYEHDATMLQTVDDAQTLGISAEFYRFKSGGMQFN